MKTKKLFKLALVTVCAFAFFVTGCNKKEEKFNITFDSNGGSSVQSQTVAKDDTATKPATPSYEGYKFIGWYNGETEYTFTEKITSDISLKARWEEEIIEPVKTKYNVTFDKNDGSAVEVVTVEEGTVTTKPADPTREGYTFDGWTLNGAEYNFSSAVNSNITLTANWTKKTTTPVVKPTDEPTKPGTVAVTKVTLNKTSLKLFTEDIETLKATVTPDNATNKAVTWNSSNKSVATVDSNGKITAVGAGTATITVTTKSGAKKATCTVTVTKPTYKSEVSFIDSALNPERVLKILNGTVNESDKVTKIELVGLRYSLTKAANYDSGRKAFIVNGNDIANATSLKVTFTDGKSVTIK